jgi:hypothetical protein
MRCFYFYFVCFFVCVFICYFFLQLFVVGAALSAGGSGGGGAGGGASPADLSFLNKGKRAGSYSSRAAALVGAVAGAPVQKKQTTNISTAASCHEARDTHHRDKVTQGCAIRSMFHKLLVP